MTPTDVVVLDDETCLVRVGESHSAIVDRDDLRLVARHRWWVIRDRSGKPRAVTQDATCNPPMILMQRLILDPPPSYQTDHINGDALDNRKTNLRIATVSQNAANAWKRPRGDGKPHSSRFKGVFWDKWNQRWRARIRVRRTVRWLGSFRDEERAARAYDRAAVEAFGEFALLNFPEEPS